MRFAWKYIGLIGVIALMGCQGNVPEKLVQVVTCAPMPEARTGAAVFSANGKGYVFGGRDDENRIHNDIYCYDSQQDSWSRIGETPLKKRVSAVACVVDGMAYVGLGFSGTIYQDKSYLKDWWQWDMAQNTWTQLASYPTAYTVNPTLFYENSKIYCTHGFGTAFSADLYVYDIATDQWQVIPRKGTEEYCTAGCGVNCKGQWFYGGGYNTNTLDHWMVIRPDGSMEKKHSLPEKVCMAACATDGEVVMVAGGRYFAGPQTGGAVKKTIWLYDPTNDSWEKGGTLPTGGESRVAMTIDGKMYVGLGNDDGNVLNSWYRIER